MKRLYTLLGLMLLLLLTVSACGPATENTQADTTDGLSTQQGAYHKITAEEAKDKMETGEVTIVDVRTAEEYAQAHIHGAISIPVESIGEQPPEALPDFNADLLIYCRTGVRSKQASEKLVALGYTNVYDFGGIQDWPYETEGNEV